MGDSVISVLPSMFTVLRISAQEHDYPWSYHTRMILSFYLRLIFMSAVMLTLIRITLNFEREAEVVPVNKKWQWSRFRIPPAPFGGEETSWNNGMQEKTV